MRCLTALLKQYKYLCLSSVRSETSRVGASPRDEVGASRNRRRILDSSESARRFRKTYPGASERNLKCLYCWIPLIFLIFLKS